MIEKVFEWTIAISLSTLGICIVFACIGLLIKMFRSFFD